MSVERIALYRRKAQAVIKHYFLDVVNGAFLSGDGSYLIFADGSYVAFAE